MELEKAVEIIKLIAKCEEFEPLNVNGEWREFVKFSIIVKKDADEKLKKVKLWTKLHGNVLSKEVLDKTIENLGTIQEAAKEVIMDREVIPNKYEWKDGMPFNKTGETTDISSLVELLVKLPWFEGEGFHDETPEFETAGVRSFNTGSKDDSGNDFIVPKYGNIVVSEKK